MAFSRLGAQLMPKPPRHLSTMKPHDLKEHEHSQSIYRQEDQGPESRQTEEVFTDRQTAALPPALVSPTEPAVSTHTGIQSVGQPA